MTTGRRTAATAPAAAATSGAQIASANGWVSSRSGDKLSITLFAQSLPALALFFLLVFLPLHFDRCLFISLSLFLFPFYHPFKAISFLEHSRAFLPYNFTQPGEISVLWAYRRRGFRRLRFASSRLKTKASTR